MTTPTGTGSITAITTHYIDGAFVESHGRQVMDVVNPTRGEVIARVTLADQEDARRAIAAAKRALLTFGDSAFGLHAADGRYGIEAFLETRAILES